VHVICSVPQGSVLGPRLFIMYSVDMADKVAEHDINFHGYADDTQLCVHCRPEEIAATTKLERCITDMDNWMSANRLKLNMDKTELLCAETRYNMSMLNDSGPSLHLNNVTVKASQHVRVLRVHLSSDLSLDKHVSSVSATCFYHLRQLRRIRRSLDADSAATLVHAFVTSRVDYCNAILAAAPKTITDRLQRVLNAAARVVSDTKKFDQGLSRLMHQELHWLDIPERVNYKLGVLTHRCLLGKALVYLSNCCIPVSQVTSQRHLRSAARHQLTVPRHSLSTYGRWAFAVAGPTMFNILPDDLRDPAVSTSTFRQSLKTHLFSAYQHV